MISTLLEALVCLTAHGAEADRPKIVCLTTGCICRRDAVAIGLFHLDMDSKSHDALHGSVGNSDRLRMNVIGAAAGGHPA